MGIRKLSIIIPVFNEGNTIFEVLKVVSNIELSNSIEKEIILVNDCSTDVTEEKIQDFIKQFPSPHIVYIRHEQNLGKGAAIRTAVNFATGDYIIIQDADLELNPADINLLLNKAVNENADVVYGSRFLSGIKIEGQNTSSYYANRFLTWFSNLCSGLKLTDMETCYKLVRTELMKSIAIKENRFGFEPEITAKLAKKKGVVISEVPISYKVRTRNEGKKIGWKDGFRSVYCILRYNLFG